MVRTEARFFPVGRVAAVAASRDRIPYPDPMADMITSLEASLADNALITHFTILTLPAKVSGC